MARKKPRAVKSQPETPPREMNEFVFLGIILVAASVLILSNLGNIYLWQDEAQTALVSKTILTHGIPLGTDGTNYFSQEEGKEYGHGYVWRWHTWLPFYVLALFFKLFGTSTFVCRLPFALFGIGTVMLTYMLGMRLWASRRAAMLGAILLMLSVPFLLLSRQCRYYAPAAFFSVAGLYAYAEMLDNRRFAPAAFVVASVLLFHTHYISYAALMGAVVFHALFFRRDRARAAIVTCAISGLLVLPWAVWLATMPYKEINAGHLFDPKAKGYLLWLCMDNTARYIFPPAALLLAVGVWLVERRRPRVHAPGSANARGNLALLIVFAVSSVTCIVLLMPFAFFRSLAAVIPVCCLIMALIAESSMRLSPVLGIALLLLFGQWARMPQYLYEITHDYDGPIEGIVTYVNAHGKDGDLVLALHEDLPLKFYTNMRVIGALTGESLADAPKADWIITRQEVIEGRELEAVDIVAKKISLHRDFLAITLDGYPDILYQNREDPEGHLFRTDQQESPVVIYRRIAR